MITQFKGEDRKDAIVNHFSLDIVGEESFFDYLASLGYTVNDDDEIIESVYDMWEKNIEE